MDESITAMTNAIYSRDMFYPEDSMTYHDLSWSRSNIGRLYLPRKEGGRGLISIEECVRKESKSLHGHLRETFKLL